ncbi:zinc ABC transporter permease AztB [Stackebrandtia nassauensis]|uniref:ABC-3 protein n=1 Tax=Stackebrandtia nassauensis (strain DSM 44728 / CIP 108903 / NRRL B-16338 / NBRC 102104 / LLR-40K-21) TaxID=446470 RepID=D3Q421_STANL|nr:zinc ABC transporter permease AztB [Stackebrandtia nassauensis]ADD45906.1 ABC-3 protein [Stackebrandtia nassauensis DSM 44728]
MDWITTPFEVGFVARAALAGLLVSAMCAVAGTWVVLRGMAFLGEAMSHGMLPGVAIAALLGGNLALGAMVSAGVVAAGVTGISRWRRLSQDTGIGLLFVGMLSLGVILVSRSQSFAVDLTGFLFGDVLSVRRSDLLILAAALLVTLVVGALGHRSFVALAFDHRKAATLGLRPRLAHAALLGLLALAMVASFQVVGTLLVFGLLIAPPAAVALWAGSVHMIMCGAAVLGAVATIGGLVISWHFDTAAGATIALATVTAFFLSAIATSLKRRPTAEVATVPSPRPAPELESTS